MPYPWPPENYPFTDWDPDDGAPDPNQRIYADTVNALVEKVVEAIELEGIPGPAGAGIITLNHDEDASDVPGGTPVGTRILRRPAP